MAGKFRFLYLQWIESIVSCKYSGDGVVLLIAPEPEVVCVTGLPARTAKRSCRLFLCKNILKVTHQVASAFGKQRVCFHVSRNTRLLSSISRQNRIARLERENCGARVSAPSDDKIRQTNRLISSCEVADVRSVCTQQVTLLLAQNRLSPAYAAIVAIADRTSAASVQENNALSLSLSIRGDSRPFCTPYITRQIIPAAGERQLYSRWKRDAALGSRTCFCFQF